MSQINPHYVDGLELRIRELNEQLAALREQLAESIAIHNRSITRMVEMAEPGFIGAFAARDMAIERTKKAESENARLREQLKKVNKDRLESHIRWDAENAARMQA